MGVTYAYWCAICGTDVLAGGKLNWCPYCTGPLDLRDVHGLLLSETATPKRYARDAIDDVMEGFEKLLKGEG